jgi:hypothetical protein
MPSESRHAIVKIWLLSEGLPGGGLDALKVLTHSI